VPAGVKAGSGFSAAAGQRRGLDPTTSGIEEREMW